MYAPYVLMIAAAVAAASLLPVPRDAYASASDGHARWDALVVLQATGSSLRQVAAAVADAWLAYSVLALAAVWFVTRKPVVYAVDFAVFEPPAAWAVSRAEIAEIMARHGVFTAESLEFMGKLLDRSATSDATHWPGSTVKLLRPEAEAAAKDEPEANAGARTDGQAQDAAGAASSAEPGVVAAKPDRSIATARANAERVMFAVVRKVLDTTRTRARDVDFLIVNCSLFCPTPSLASSICKEFGLRSDVRSYNLGGMGCSAGVISIDLAKQLLENRPNSLALVVSFEEISQQLYLGNDRAMLVQNTLFRVGGAAVLLSNRAVDAFRAKYKLLHTVRVQDTSDAAHACVYQKEDAEGVRGIALSKDVTTVAAKTLRDNLTILGPAVLPLREQAKVLLSIAARRATSTINGWLDAVKLRVPGLADGRLPKPSVYVPDFKLGVQHFCIHAGGRAVIDGIEKNLSLHPHHTAPSRATLFNFGNTSSSSIWYELKYVEAEEPKWTPSAEMGGSRRIQRGERVLQIAFGSGFKCNSAVWLRLK